MYAGLLRGVSQLAAESLHDAAYGPLVVGVPRAPDPLQQQLVGQHPALR